MSAPTPLSTTPRLIGSPDVEVTDVSESTCAVDGCDRDAEVRGWCNGHYHRQRRTGNAGPPFRPRSPDYCCIVKCGRPCYTRGLCSMHYQRWRSHGDPLHERVYVKGEGAPGWGGDDITYVSAHFRVRRTKGPASGYTCVQCGGKASEWAYDHQDPNEQIEKGKGPYSTKIDHYRPMCGRCHTRMDCDPMREWAPWRAAARDLAEVSEGRPGWYVSLRGRLAHYAPSGAGANWRTLCGDSLRWPGTPASDFQLPGIMCERCQSRGA